MKTRIKILIAFVMLSEVLLPIAFALPNAQSNTNAQSAPQVTVPGIVPPNDGPNSITALYFPYAYYVGGGWYWDNQIGYIYPYSNGVCYFYTYNRYYYPGAGSFDYSNGIYIYDFYYASWTYTSKSLWHWVYYYSYGQWFSNDFH